MIGDIMGPSKTIKVLQKNSTPEKKKSVAILILDQTQAWASTLRRTQWLEDQKRNFSEAFQKVGVTSYEIVEREDLSRCDKDYLVTIEVEQATAFNLKVDSTTTRLKAALVVTLADKRTDKVLAKIAGTSENNEWTYDLNKFTSNLLKEMLQKIYAQ